MRRIFVILILMFAFIISSQIVSAQPPPPPPQDIPIDGGLTVLLIGGLLYGAREIYKHDKKNKTN